MEACSEIFVNKRFLEDLPQNPVDHFAYPFGGKSACGQREAILVQEEGYKTAVTTHHGSSLNDTCKARIFFHGSGLPAVRFS